MPADEKRVRRRPDCADGSDETTCTAPADTSTSGVVIGLAVALAIAVLAAGAMYFRQHQSAAGSTGTNNGAAEDFTVVNAAFGRPEGGVRRESVDGTLPRLKGVPLGVDKTMSWCTVSTSHLSQLRKTSFSFRKICNVNLQLLARLSECLLGVESYDSMRICTPREGKLLN